MREILFRGKTKDGEWRYGDLLQDEGKFYIVEHDGWSTFYPKSGTADVYMHEVIPESVGQYTGLEDFYDTKIFEGDVICGDEEMGGYFIDPTNYENNCTVSWINKDLRYLAELKPSSLQLIARYARTFKVIGNLFDDPGLLKRREIDI